MVALLWMFQQLLAVARRSVVPEAAAGVGRGLQPRPRRQRRAEDDGHHRRRAARRRLHRRRSGSIMWVILMAHAAIALGTLSGGWRIIHTMGSKITKLQPVGGFAAETAGRDLAVHGDAPRRPGQHDAHDHRRDHRRRIDPAPLGGPLGRRRPHRLGVGPDDSHVRLHLGGHLLHRRVHDRAVGAARRTARVRRGASAAADLSGSFSARPRLSAERAKSSMRRRTSANASRNARRCSSSVPCDGRRIRECPSARSSAAPATSGHVSAAAWSHTVNTKSIRGASGRGEFLASSCCGVPSVAQAVLP